MIERENEVSVSGETEIILWNKVNKDELSTFMFKEKYNIYDNSKWTRNAFDMRYF